MSYKEKLSELLIDEDKEIEEIIELIKPFLGISKQDGRIIFRKKIDELSDHNKILLYAIGAKFAFDLKLRNEPFITNREIMGFLKKDKNPVSGRISELKQLKKLKSIEKGKHVVNPVEINNDIKEIVKILEKVK